MKYILNEELFMNFLEVAAESYVLNQERVQRLSFRKVIKDVM